MRQLEIREDQVVTPKKRGFVHEEKSQKRGWHVDAWREVC